jgi:hypothetical protein
MKLYQATFRGRKAGAIGIFYTITTTVKGKDKKEARLNLYKDYDHIMNLKLKEVD